MLEVKTALDLRKAVDKDVPEILVTDERLVLEVIQKAGEESFPFYRWNPTTCQFVSIPPEILKFIKDLLKEIIVSLVEDGIEWLWKILTEDNDEGSAAGNSTVLSTIRVMKNKGYKAEIKKDETTGKNSIKFFK